MVLEEIKKALAEDATLKTGLIAELRDEVLNAAKTQGFSIRTKDEEAQFLKNYESTVLPAKIEEGVAEKVGEKMKTVLDGIDESVFKLTGKKKNGSEKTVEFVQRVIGESKTGEGTEELKQLLKQAQDELDKKKDWIPKEKFEEVQKNFFTQKLDSRISSSLEKFQIAVPAHITDEAEKQQYVENQKRLMKLDFLSRYQPKEDKEGNIIYHEGESILMDSASGKAMNEAQIFEKSYSSYFVKADPKKGSGSNRSGGGQVDPDEAALKSKEEVNKHLDAKGLAMGSKERTKEYQRIVQEFGITE